VPRQVCGGAVSACLAGDCREKMRVLSLSRGRREARLTCYYAAQSVYARASVKQAPMCPIMSVTCKRQRYSLLLPLPLLKATNRPQGASSS